MNHRWISRLMFLYLIFFAVSRPHVQTTLLSLVFSGVIPGTDIVIPFWAMLVIYLLMIVGIVTYFFGGFRKPEAPTTPRARMPRRRYSHI